MVIFVGIWMLVVLSVFNILIVMIFVVYIMVFGRGVCCLSSCWVVLIFVDFVDMVFICILVIEVFECCLSVCKYFL